MILNPAFLEVDDTGDLDPELSNLELSEMRGRDWGEVFASSYGPLLATLEHDLNMTLEVGLLGERNIRSAWAAVQQAAQQNTLRKWGVREVEPVSETELEKFATYQYPVYACGYNWLQSCSESAKRTLLPPATFTVRLPDGRAASCPTIIRRRTRWELLRPDGKPAEEPAAPA